MPLTDEELNILFIFACEVWGKNNSPSDTYPDSDPTTGDFAAISDGITIFIDFWNHDSPQPTINDLKALDLADVEGRRKSAIVGNTIDRISYIIEYLVNIEQRVSALERADKTEQQSRDYITALLTGRVPNVK
jgi:hypothetical protein